MTVKITLACTECKQRNEELDTDEAGPTCTVMGASASQTVW